MGYMHLPLHPLLGRHKWDNRLLLLFSPSEEDERYMRQLEELQKYQAGLWERDVLLFHVFPYKLIVPKGGSLDQSESASLRRHFIIPEKETVALLIGKDGREKLRSRELLTAERLFLTIDALPMGRRDSGDF